MARKSKKNAQKLIQKKREHKESKRKKKGGGRRPESVLAPAEAPAAEPSSPAAVAEAPPAEAPEAEAAEAEVPPAETPEAAAPEAEAPPAEAPEAEAPEAEAPPAETPEAAAPEAEAQPAEAPGEEPIALGEAAPPDVEALVLQAEEALLKGQGERAEQLAGQAGALLEQQAEDWETRRRSHFRNRTEAVKLGRVLGALEVDLGDVARAMMAGTQSGRFWMDPAGPEVVQRSLFTKDRGDVPGHPFPIPPLDRNQARGLRSLFVSQMPGGGTREHLEEAVDDGPRFDGILAGDAEAMHRWEGHLRTMLGGWARDLLFERGYRVPG